MKEKEPLEHEIAAGESRVVLRAQLPPGQRLTVQVEIKDETGKVVERREVRFRAGGAGLTASTLTAPDFSRNGFPRALAWARANTASLLFGLSLFIYLLTRLISLDVFPIYFFTDEAVQTVLAADFVRDGFRSYDKELFPTYFVNGNQYNLSVSVYLQVLPYLLFDKSIWVTRGVSVLVSLLAVISVSLLLKDIFGLRHYWLGALFLSITPAWFLHSRTAFETVLAVSFYAAFLYCYLLYRTRSPRWLFAAAAFGALTFYSYSPAQLVVAVTALGLFFSDLRYHWQQRKTVLAVFGLTALLALPYVRFLIAHPDENLKHLQILDSYWLREISTGEKLRIYLDNYLGGINPFYWYLPNSQDLARHLMKGYGHLLRWTLPLALIGLGLALRGIRHSENRAVLIALLAGPSGAALVAPGITRLLVMVIPAALLTALGAAQVIRWLERLKLPAAAVGLAVFLALGAYNFGMLADALRNGPTWYQDYGLGGLQFGAGKVFPAIRQYLEENPKARVILSPAWSNGTDVVARFFMDGQDRFELAGIETYLNEVKPISDGTIFVLMPEELEQVKESGKFKPPEILMTIPYPNGKPGFIFTRLTYADNIEAILARERQARKALLEKYVRLPDGSSALVRYSREDMGQIENLFDGDLKTLMRTLEANPMQVILSFDQPQTASGVTVRVGGVPTRIEITLETVEGESRTFAQQAEGTPDPKDMRIEFGQTFNLVSLQVSVRSVNDGEPAHVHVWEITLIR